VKRTSFIGLLLLAAMMIGCTASKNETSSVPSITPAKSAELLGHDTSVVFLDVRTSKEFQSETGHLQGAIHIPVDSLEFHLMELDPYKSKTIVAYCRTGHRSSRAQKFLAEKGFHVLSMTGGITRWNKEQLPVVKEQQ
jgi:rhodanese-related sulfurtransferase